MASHPTSSRFAALSLYRELLSLIRALPIKKQSNALNQVRVGFRENINANPSEVANLLQVAEKRAAFLRMSTPLNKQRRKGQPGVTTYVYRGEGAEELGKATLVNKGGVVSNWSGNNLDPCSVKRHYAGLRRAGFVNNTHAKGIF